MALYTYRTPSGETHNFTIRDRDEAVIDGWFAREGARFKDKALALATPGNPANDPVRGPLADLTALLDSLLKPRNRLRNKQLAFAMALSYAMVGHPRNF